MTWETKQCFPFRLTAGKRGLFTIIVIIILMIPTNNNNFKHHLHAKHGQNMLITMGSAT